MRIHRFLCTYSIKLMFQAEILEHMHKTTPGWVRSGKILALLQAQQNDMQFTYTVYAVYVTQRSHDYAATPYLKQSH